MRFMACEIPEKWECADWVRDMFEDTGKNKAWIVDADDHDDARRKVYDEIYMGITVSDAYEIAEYEIMALSEDDTEDFIMSDFGERDGKIIMELIEEYREWENDEENEEEFPMIHKKMYSLSEKTIKELCFQRDYMDIGLIEIKKELE